MEKANKIFYIILSLLIVGSIGITFLKIVILKNYQIIDQVSCDPKIEKCFMSECDPASDDTCPVDPAQRISYYKKISKNAGVIYACGNTAEKIGCEGELSCTVGEQKCSYMYCDQNNLEDGEKCAEQSQ